MSEHDEKYYSTQKVAETFGVTTETIRNWISRGTIQGAIKIGNYHKVPRSEVIRLAQERYGDGSP